MDAQQETPADSQLDHSVIIAVWQRIYASYKGHKPSEEETLKATRRLQLYEGTQRGTEQFFADEEQMMDLANWQPNRLDKAIESMRTWFISTFTGRSAK